MRTFIVCTILVFCCLLVGCKGFAYRTPTENMLPTIKVGDTCIVDQYSNFEIKRFDIVMCKAPDEIAKGVKDVKIIKRIIGMPTDKLQLKASKIYVNDILLDEPFEKINNETDGRKDFGPITIPENHYFLLGDNRPNSLDSRYWKKPTIPKEDILGKVIQILPIDVKK
jgi:signal peptidase I